jgi:hypothetical protein
LYVCSYTREERESLRVGDEGKSGSLGVTRRFECRPMVYMCLEAAHKWLSSGAKHMQQKSGMNQRQDVGCMVIDVPCMRPKGNEL